MQLAEKTIQKTKKQKKELGQDRKVLSSRW